MHKIEHQIQVACVRWFRFQYANKIIFAIPNGGARSVTTGAMLKAEGVTRGVPDLFIPEPCGMWHGLFVEMKTEKGIASQYQKVMINALTIRGYRCEICRSLEEFIKIVQNYLLS